MPTSHTLFNRLFHRFSKERRGRSNIVRKFAQKIGLVYFGSIDQHDDDIDAIHGFTASLSHRDTQYSVGTYSETNVRLVNRFDMIRVAKSHRRQQLWTIIEIELEPSRLPHMFLIPTGASDGEYGRIYSLHSQMQPLNSMIWQRNSPAIYGKFQIVASPSRAHYLEHVFTSSVMIDIVHRFWPHAIEIERNKLLVYIIDKKMTMATLESSLVSAMWLAKILNDSTKRLAENVEL